MSEPIRELSEVEQRMMDNINISPPSEDLNVVMKKNIIQLRKLLIVIVLNQS